MKNEKVKRMVGINTCGKKRILSVENLKIRECRKKIDHSDDIFIIVEMQQMISFFPEIEAQAIVSAFYSYEKENGTLEGVEDYIKKNKLEIIKAIKNEE